MDESESEQYNLRGKKRPRNSKRFENSERSRSKRSKQPNRARTKRVSYPSDGVAKFTKDGYIEDGFVQDDSYYVENSEQNPYFELDSEPIQKDIIDRMVETGDIDPEVAESIVQNAFKGTGEELIQNYIGTKPSTDSWKLNQSETTVKRLEPELKKIRNLIEEETPTIPKILESNITLDDKKRCIKLFDQLNNTEPYTSEHDTIIETINNIIRKGKKYTKAEIEKLESIETNLKVIAVPPDNLKNQILTLDANDNVKGIIYGQYLEMLEHEPGSQAYNSIREEIEWSVRLPHNKSHSITDLMTMNKEELNEFYTRFLNEMDKELYGMEKIKWRMIEIINDRRRSGDACGRNIAIVGPPGTGKTAIAKALAKTLEVPFEKISVGGLDDVSVVKGSNRVWNSAEPSVVLQILSRIKSSSGVVLLDELDGTKKEVQQALLHMTDYVHNKEFRDNYLNKYSHDISRILFIFTMNKTDTLDPALLSRMDILEAPGYTDAEKKIILQNYTLPRALTTIGLGTRDVIIDDKAANKLVIATRNDPGVREIEKAVKCLVGKVNMCDSVILEDGTTGTLKLPYKIPNFKLPLKIGSKLLIDLTKEKINY